MELERAVGLCGNCRWSRRSTNRRGSVFWLCRRAAIDERYAKYPRLPVVECEGYDSEEDDGS